ncbi:MAG: gamma-glutamyltransferase [Candidatus Lokiarchaeota archaeon]|nr:gamma-glutamyltransferase [Candidatus Lokiarchaeota archaeon]
MNNSNANLENPFGLSAPRFEQYLEFPARRSPIVCKNGVVATSQPLAAQAGLSILQKGGNAADAAVATAAALNVVEPMSTGVGGDCFCLFFNAKKKKVYGINGSGRCPAELTIEKIREDGIIKNKLPASSPHAVTVPGTVAGWIDTIEKFGTMPINTILKPAISLARNGFPVSPLIALAWSMGQVKLWRTEHGKELLKNGKSPMPGEIFRNRSLANVLTEISEKGEVGFYQGWVADRIIEILKDKGAMMTHEDLKGHTSKIVKPIRTNYRGIDVYEIPPNGQGITALIALNILEEFNIAELDIYSADYYHILIEALRLAFSDAKYWIADPEFQYIPIQQLISKEYSKDRAKLVNLNKATLDHQHGVFEDHSDTVYLSVVDGFGNACSFINSNYAAFGTGIVPKSTGFVLQNRGACFILDPDHPNALEPNKRPYHTIIPGMATKDGELYASFGVMGGIMQPQGHVQVLSKMIDHGYEPQTALNAPRFCIHGGNPNGAVHLEEGISEDIIHELKKRGHHIIHTIKLQRHIFGNGQIIRRNEKNGVLWAGSEPRCDGCAYGF